MTDTIPRHLMLRALENAERSRDFEELYIHDLHEQIDRHQKTLDMYRTDIARFRAYLDEDADA